MQYFVALQFDSVDDVDAVDQQFQGIHVDSGNIAGDRPVHLSIENPLRMQPDVVSMVFEYLDRLPVPSAECIAPSVFGLAYLLHQSIDSEPHIRVSGIEENLLLTFLHFAWPPGTRSDSPSSSRCRRSCSAERKSSPDLRARKQWQWTVLPR